MLIQSSPYLLDAESQKPVLLIIDDQPDNIRTLVSFLEHSGYSVSYALDAEAGMSRLAFLRPDLILLDLFMPKINGLQFCEQLKKNPTYQDIPIIFLTASDNEQDVITAFEKGAVDYLKKPFNIHEVLVRVKVHIKLRQQTLALERTKHELFKANRRLENLSSLDTLTKIPNRYNTFQILASIWARSIAQDFPLVCMIVDVDFLRNINHTYGYHNGDLVLTQLARTLKESTRAEDMVCSLGGDEFLIICSQTDQETGIVLAGMIHQKVSELRVNFETGSWSGHVSIGIASRTPAMHTYEDLMKSADQGLAMAKSRGKNCVYFFEMT
jgi:diguanylate cyclase (GGDEF)-like protein